MTEFLVGVVSTLIVVGATWILFKSRDRADRGFDIVDNHTIGIQTADGRVNVSTPNGVRADQVDSARIAEGGDVEITTTSGRKDRVTGVVRDPDNPYR
jgi:hypothetical protein